MAVVRWDPFELPLRWRRWLDVDAETPEWLRVEEVRENGTLLIRAEVPGVDPEKDVDVSVTDGMLRITARRQEKSEDKAEGRYRSEFRYGEFARTVALPPGVDKDSVEAEYKDGILEVRIPWPAEPQPATTKVPIRRS